MPLKMSPFNSSTLWLAPLVLALSACAVSVPPSAAPSQVAAAWQAPLPAPQQTAGAQLPHQGSLGDLSRWWAAQGDPLLAELIRQAQAVSPSVASARVRISTAQAARTAAGAASLPSLDAAVIANRGPATQAAGNPLTTTAQAGLQASWEIDLFGGNRANASAAAQRLAGAEAGWHEARVSVAAEVAMQYIALRSCRQLEAVTRADAQSRAETARLSRLSGDAAFTPPATVALASASAAEANARAVQQRAQCAQGTKALVALTGMAEADLLQALQTPAPTLNLASALPVASVPAQALAQRPDVFAAERDVAAASADTGAAQAQRFPRLSLNGSVGKVSVSSGGDSSTQGAWSIGPLTLTLPLFDAGRRAANVRAAEARYTEAVAVYRAQVRQAVREVEDALVNLQATAERSTDVQTAVAGYRASFAGTEARYKAGLASLVELEDARRALLAAQFTEASLLQERQSAWVALYRAVGGGWTPAATSVSSAAP